MGRNIYQAACGTAGSAVEYLDRLNSELNKMRSNVSFHVLNGMLYEIYFNANGQKREIGKTDFFDKVFYIEDNKDFSSSFSFIRQVLKPYEKGLFYIPGTLRDVNINVTTKVIEVDKPAISAVFYEGDNVLFNEKGDSYFDPLEDDDLFYMKIKEFSEMLAGRLMTPRQHLEINYTEELEQDTRLLVPYSLKIQRYSK